MLIVDERQYTYASMSFRKQNDESIPVVRLSDVITVTAFSEARASLVSSFSQCCLAIGCDTMRHRSLSIHPRYITAIVIVPCPICVHLHARAVLNVLTH